MTPYVLYGAKYIDPVSLAASYYSLIILINLYHAVSCPYTFYMVLNILTQPPRVHFRPSLPWRPVNIYFLIILMTWIMPPIRFVPVRFVWY